MHCRTGKALQIGLHPQLTLHVFSKHHFLLLLLHLSLLHRDGLGLFGSDYFWFFGGLLLDLIIIQNVNDFLSYFFLGDLGDRLPDSFDLDVAALVFEAFEGITHIVKQILLLLWLDVVVLFDFSDQRNYIVREVMR